MSSEEDLTQLDLRNQHLTTLDEDTIKKYGPTCTRLDLTGNSINNFDWIARFPVLNELILDRNGISNLKSWPKSKSVTTLYLNNNNIDDIRELMDCVVKSFPNLTYLSLHRNPCTPDMYSCESEAEAYQRFRYYVIYRMPALQLLDATEVQPEELKEAKRHLMAPAKPTTEAKVDVASTAIPGTTSSTGAYDLRKVIESKNTRVATFLVKSRPRYDGFNSEGNRFITNEDL